MDEEFTIYVDRLRNGAVEAIDLTLSADCLEQDDERLRFEGVVVIRGEAYVAEDELVLHLSLEATALVPCVICQKELQLPLVVKGLYHAEPLKQVPTALYCFRLLVRETLILEAPQLAECGGKCPERKDIEHYLSKGDAQYHPFADLNLKELSNGSPT